MNNIQKKALFVLELKYSDLPNKRADPNKWVGREFYLFITGKIERRVDFFLNQKLQAGCFISKILNEHAFLLKVR